MDPLEQKLAELKTALEKSASESAKLEVKTAIETFEKEAKGAFSMEIKSLKDELETQLKAAQDHIDKLDVKLQAKNAKTEVKTLVNIIEDHKDGIEKSVKTKGADFEFEVKADVLRASVVDNPNAFDLNDVGQLAHRKLTLYDLFPKVPVGPGSNGVVRYTDWDAATIVRAAAMVAESGTFPESTAKWATYTLNLRKIGDIIPVSEEVLYDAPRFASELNQFLQTNVAIVRDTQLYSGDDTGENLKGIVTSIDAYTPVASGITDANIYDLVSTVRAAISGPYGSKYSPNFGLMNISDIQKMKLKKDANNNYVMPPFVNADGSVVDGITILECNAVTANTMIIGDSRYAKIYEIPGVAVTTGHNGTNFGEDMVSIKARTRLALLIRNADKTGFLKVTSISAALTTLATP